MNSSVKQFSIDTSGSLSLLLIMSYVCMSSTEL